MLAWSHRKTGFQLSYPDEKKRAWRRRNLMKVGIDHGGNTGLNTERGNAIFGYRVAKRV
jgi:hypothetical protein